MLKLVRRPVTEFLGPEQRDALQARVDAATTLACDASLTNAEKSKRIGQRWDDFRAGKTSKGVFAALWLELQAMAFEKCALCETPAPGTVEHLEEKSTRPVPRVRLAKSPRRLRYLQPKPREQRHRSEAPGSE